MPEAVSYRSVASGWRRRNSSSSFFSQSRRCARVFSFSSAMSAPGDALAIEIAIVHHALRLELGARQRSLRQKLEPGTHSDARLQPLAHVPLQRCRVAPGRDLDADEQVVHRLAPRDDDAE